MTSKAPERINSQSSNVPSSPSGIADKKLLNRYGAMKHVPTEKISEQIGDIVRSHFEQLLKDGYGISDIVVASDYLQSTISCTCSDLKLKHSVEVRTKERKSI